MSTPSRFVRNPYTAPNPYTAHRLWQPDARASATSRAVIWAGRLHWSRIDVAVIPADLADRYRLARHRRALHAGGGVDVRVSGHHCCGVRLHARDRSAYV